MTENPEIWKLAPAFQNYLWGGEQLTKRFGYRTNCHPLAEAWVLSCHPNGQSTVQTGRFAGLPLGEAIARAGGACLGERGRAFGRFPVLIKLIDAKRTLSVQVHPDDAYAMRHEGEPGKTELWYVLACEPGAFLSVGLRRSLTKEELIAEAESGEIEADLRKIPVSPGDCVMIPAGTVHAIGAGVLLAEIQQNSDSTYRLYDFKRAGADGKPRPLRAADAAEVAVLTPGRDPVRHIPDEGRLGVCPYFTADLISVRNEHRFTVDGSSFLATLCIEGACSLGGVPLAGGECAFVPAGAGEFCCDGRARLITCRV